MMQTVIKTMILYPVVWEVGSLNVLIGGETAVV